MNEVNNKLFRFPNAVSGSHNWWQTEWHYFGHRFVGGSIAGKDFDWLIDQLPRKLWMASSSAQPPIYPPPSSQPEAVEEEEQAATESPDNEEEEDDEEEEPQLKYERVGGDLAKVVRSDLVSAFAVGSKYIVFTSLRYTRWVWF